MGRKKLLSLKQKNPIGVGFERGERGLLTVVFTYSGHKERGGVGVQYFKKIAKTRKLKLTSIFMKSQRTC